MAPHSNRKYFSKVSLPNSLVSCALCAKYCPNSSLLTAPYKAFASWGWKSILFGRDLLRRGVKWLVVTSGNINVWSDYWVSAGDQLKLLKRPQHEDVDLLVQSLISTSGGWDVHKVQTMSSHEEASFVLNTPVSRLGFNDKLAWHLTNTGTLLNRVISFLQRTTGLMTFLSLLAQVLGFAHGIWAWKTDGDWAGLGFVFRNRAGMILAKGA